MIMKTSLNHITDRSQPGSAMTAPPAVHQDGGVKYATGAPTNKIRGRNDITICTWNVMTLRAAGKLKELTHDMERMPRCDGKALVKHRPKKDTRYTSVARRTNTNKALGFLFSKTS